MRRTLLLLALLAAACAHQAESDWTRDGVSAARIRQDSDECTEAAKLKAYEQLVKLPANSGLTAGHWNPTPHSRVGRPSSPEQFRLEREHRDACMTERGYRRT